MSPSWLIDCRNAGNPLIDYTARPDEEWRHVPNNGDKIDETHLQEREYFYTGFKAKKWYIFFFKNTFTDYFPCGKSGARKKQFITIDWKNRNIYNLYLSSAKRVLYWTLVFFYGASTRFSGLCDQPVAETSTWQHTTPTTDKHPCTRRDSNPQSQQESDRRPTP